MRENSETTFFSLNVVNIEMPALRDRTEDIPLLVSYFTNKLNQDKGYNIKCITGEAMGYFAITAGRAM